MHEPEEGGLTTAGKAGIVVIPVVIARGAAYLAPSLSTGGGTHSTSSSQPAGFSSMPSGNRTLGLLSLFGYFYQMQVQESTYDRSDGAQAYFDHHTVAYLVLGKASLNSTQYTRVEFSQTGVDTDVIAWFTQQGGVDRVDVLGVGNYTGSSGGIYMQVYILTFSLITGLSNNTTLLSLLRRLRRT